MSLPTDAFLQQACAFACQLADAARPIALRHFRQILAIEHKADLSPVTIADRAIETELRRQISARFPEHGILGEEFGVVEAAGTEFCTWVVDPIDGTRSFITGLPLFGTLIALLHGSRPVLGVIDIPATGERWIGQQGVASRLNAVGASTSDCNEVAKARVYTTSPDLFSAEDWPRFDALSRKAAMRRYGGDCYSYGLLASGHCDLVVETGLQAYDYLALVPVVEGAGGRISDWQGAPLDLQSDGRVVAAAGEALWRQAIEALR